MGAFTQVRKWVSCLPGMGLTKVVPNTVAFMFDSLVGTRRERPLSSAPVPSPSLSLAAQVAVDELLLGIMRSPKRYPPAEAYARVGDEVSRAHAFYAAQGWIERPHAYHLEPRIPEVTQWRIGSVRGVAYEHISWPSAYEPRDEEPGADRWQAFVPNRQAHAWLVRSPQPTSSWLVCVHGFGMGMPLSDFHVFRAQKLARELGLNLAFPVLPLHGPRKQSWMSGAEFMSFELLHPVFAVSQAVSDIRGLMTWLQRMEGAQRFGLYGISLGGYVASLLAGIDERFEMVIAGIPVTDFVELFSHHSPRALRQKAIEHAVLGEQATQVHKVVSPLAFAPRVPLGQRYIYGALGDRMATAKQSHRLWQHWGESRIEWLPAGHVVALMRRSVDRFVTDALVASHLPSAAAHEEVGTASA